VIDAPMAADDAPHDPVAKLVGIAEKDFAKLRRAT
jgi:hypothetical protein